MNKKNIGSSFDDFLEEEGVLEEAEAVAAKRVFVFELEQAMKKRKISKTELAKLLHTSRSAVNRILNPNKPSTLKSLCGAARAVGKKVHIHVA